MLRPVTVLALALALAPAAALVAPAAPQPVLPGEGPFTLATIARDALSLIDADGKVVRAWPTPVSSFIHDAEILPNGHVLMTVGFAGILHEGAKLPYAWPAPGLAPDPIGSWIVEVDASGVVVWTLTHAGGQMLTWTHDTDYLEETGTFLVADTTSDAEYPDRVVEVDRAGNVLWAYYPGEGAYPNDADRLPNGNTLVSLRNRDTVVEVAPTGEVVWSFGPGVIEGQHNPDRLANGNTMIADSEHNRILEVTPAGDIAWSYGGAGVLKWPRDADALPNGNVLITDSHNFRIVEVTRAGQVVWEIETHALVLNYDSDRVNVPPAIRVESPAPGATTGALVDFDVEVADDSATTATYRLFDVDAGGWFDAAWMPLPSAPWTRLLPAGDYRLDVAATDHAGEGGGFPQDDSVRESASASSSFTVG